MPNENGLIPLGEFAQQEFLIGTPPSMVFTRDGQRVDRELLGMLLQLRQAQANERLAAAMEAQQEPKEMLVLLHPDQAHDFRELIGEREKSEVTAGLEIKDWCLVSPTELDVFVSYPSAEAAYFLGQYWQVRKQKLRLVEEGQGDE